MIRLASALLISLLIAPTSAQAASTVTYDLCYGEYEDRCRTLVGPYDIYVGVNISEDTMGRQVCTVRDGNRMRTYRYNVVQMSSVPGNCCGYGIFRVTCFFP